MKRIFVLSTLILMIFTTIVLATDTTNIQGEYIEARSASVYVGACHFGAEYVEGGKEATMVWNIQQGTWNDVSLDGLTVVAVVSAKENLAIDFETRKSVLYIDTNVTSEQQAALKDMLATKQAKELGTIVATQTAPINFSKNGTKYNVEVGNVLTLTANRYPCVHCTQPHQIWYKPLIALDNPIVGKSEVYRYKDSYLTVNWQQGDVLNNVFVGSFSM